jgi:L-lactate dehydrogenase
MASSIAIVGAGTVGTAAAYAIVLGSLCNLLLLVDVKTHVRDGQVRDLSDAAWVENSITHVRAANYKEAAQCDVIIIAACTKQNMG